MVLVMVIFIRSYTVACGNNLPQLSPGEKLMSFVVVNMSLRLFIATLYRKRPKCVTILMCVYSIMAHNRLGRMLYGLQEVHNSN
jgi:hypothetical protein